MSVFAVYERMRNNVVKANNPFHGSWKVTKLLHETKARVDLAQFENWK